MWMYNPDFPVDLSKCQNYMYMPRATEGCLAGDVNCPPVVNTSKWNTNNVQIDNYHQFNCPMNKTKWSHHATTYNSDSWNDCAQDCKDEKDGLRYWQYDTLL